MGDQPPDHFQFAPSFLQPGAERLLEIAVRGDGGNASITVKADGQNVFEWSGPKDRLEDDGQHSVNCPAGKLALTASMSANATYRDLRARRVTGAAALPIAATAPLMPPAPGSVKNSEVLAFAGHRYQFVAETGIPFPEAKIKAQSMGGHLATVTSKGEHDFIVELCATPLAVSFHQAWLGGVRAAAGPDGWKWITGEPFGFTVWGAQTPSSNAPGDGIALMNENHSFAWNDFELADVRSASMEAYIRGFVVEWDDDGKGSLGPQVGASSEGWTNLLANVDVKRDAVTGEWLLEKGELVSLDGSATHRTLELPVAHEPKDYDLRLQVTRRKGGAAMFFALRSGGAGAALLFDGWTGSKENSSEVMAVLSGALDEAGGKFVNSRQFFGDLARHEILVQVRAERVTVSLDGKELLNRKGGLTGLAQTDAGFLPAGRRTGPVFAVGVCGGEVVFHSIEIKPMDVTVALAPRVPEMPGTLSGDARLTQLEAGFKARYEADAQKVFLTAVAALNQSYAANGIARARAAAQKAGRLDEITALDAEKARIEKGEGVPAEDAEGTPASLTGLRKTYRDAMAKQSAERDRKAAPLYELYLGALDNYITDLTKAGKLDDARSVKTLRDEVALRKPAVSSASVAATKPDPPKSGTPLTVKTPEVKSSGGSYWREAAKWLVSNGGTCRVVSNKSELDVKTEKEIPAGKFDIVELTLDRYNSVLPPTTDADFKVFNGIKTLRRVWVRTTGLSDAAFAFLAANPELVWINLEGVPDLTDGVLLHLTNARKLAFCSINGAKNFTGKGLAQMRWLPVLANADFPGTGISDEGLKALAMCKQIKTIRVGGGGGTATDAGFTALRGLKSLTGLTASATAFGDEAAAAIAEIGGLTSLDLTGTKLTDTGLAKLLALKRLTSLNLGGSQVTEAATAAFQKALPQCRVTR